MSSILVSQKKSDVYITLNRPEALNALNHDMVLAITKALMLIRERDDIHKVIFNSIGDKAFCAGGDVKIVHQAGSEWMNKGRVSINPAWEYFCDEYKMNTIIHHFPKPIISLCQGYVMGGGYGIAGNGSHIVVCESTKFAMPETILGFFPDVGIGWKLARAGALGMYIALTGEVFGPDMMMASGLATHFLSCKEFENFCPLQLDKNKKIHEISNKEQIESIFSLDSVEEIFNALEEDGSDFAKNTLAVLKKRSPISLLVTFKHITMAKEEDYDTAIKRDYQLACAFFNKEDIYEGIRAQVIDKDRSPKWQYASINNILQADIDYYFDFVDHRLY